MNCVFERGENEEKKINMLDCYIDCFYVVLFRLLKQRSSCSLNHYVERSALSTKFNRCHIRLLFGFLFSAIMFSGCDVINVIC